MIANVIKYLVTSLVSVSVLIVIAVIVLPVDALSNSLLHLAIAILGTVIVPRFVAFGKSKNSDDDKYSMGELIKFKYDYIENYGKVNDSFLNSLKIDVEKYKNKYGEDELTDMVERLLEDLTYIDDSDTDDDVDYSEQPEHNCFPHTLLFGMGGLGKTSMVRLIHKYLVELYGHDVKLFFATPSVLKNKQALDEIFLNITPYSIVFIDEIHGLKPQLAEAIYGAMQDRKYSLSGSDNIDFGNGISINVESGVSGEIDLPPFTLIGATTDRGLLPRPFLDRFILELEMKPYSEDEIYTIIKNKINGIQISSFDDYVGQKHVKELIIMAMKAMGMGDPREIKFPPRILKKADVLFDDNAIREIAKRSLSTPRIAKKLTDVVINYALANDYGYVTVDHVREALDMLGIDENGLADEHRRVIKALIDRDNKPIGTRSLANSAGVSQADLDNIIIPQLVNLGIMGYDNRGWKVLTEKGLREYSHIT